MSVNAPDSHQAFTRARLTRFAGRLRSKAVALAEAYDRFPLHTRRLGLILAAVAVGSLFVFSRVATGAGGNQEEVKPAESEVDVFKKFAQDLNRRLRAIEARLDQSAFRRTRSLHRKLNAATATPWQENGLSGWQFKVPFTPLTGFEVERLEARLDGNLYDRHDVALDIDVMARRPQTDEGDQPAREITVIVASQERSMCNDLERLVMRSKRTGEPLATVTLSVTEREIYDSPLDKAKEKTEEMKDETKE